MATRRQRISAGVRIGSAVLFLLSLGLAQEARAATRFVATTGADGGNSCLVSASPCRTITHTLTQAVAADTILVAAGTYGLALGETFPLMINLDLTLTGAGPGSTIVDATGANTHVIKVHAATVTIGGVTITGGLVNCVGGCDSEGGGLFNDGALTLTNSWITGNTTSCDSTGGGGCNASAGGLHNVGALTVKNSTIRGNTARCFKKDPAGFCEAFGGGVYTNGTATFTNSTVSENSSACTNSSNAFCRGDGAGLTNDGTLTLINSIVSGNTASCLNSATGECVSRGGGLKNPLGATTAVINSTVSENTVTCRNNGASNTSCEVIGGGVSNSGTLTLTNSTVSGNTATCTNTTGFACEGSGGGLSTFRVNDVSAATAHITNSTVSGNTVSCNGTGGPCFVAGGGIFNHGTLTLASATLTGNSVTCSGTNCTALGGGVRSDDQAPTLLNTIVANNPQGGNCNGSITSLGHNLSSDASCAFAGLGDLNSTNPLLGLLQDNGGPTRTHALLAGSPAIDAGSNAGCSATDQRAFRRPAAATCDIGAFEANTVATALLGSVLPTERTARAPALGPATTVTAFATILNIGGATAVGCAIAPFTPVSANFTYQTTNTQNQLVGTPNTPANVPAGQAQNFVFAFTPTSAFPRTEVQLSFACTNSTPAPIIPGVDTFFLRATVTPSPDIVALNATSPNDGILRLVGGVGAFAVAAVNVGAPGLMTVSANTGGASLPVTMTLCETNPQTGECVNPPSATVQTQIDTNATPTFSFFVTATAPIPFDPATNRIQVSFEGGGGGGGTSLAVCTMPLCP